jgi:hypothetical protein
VRITRPRGYLGFGRVTEPISVRARVNGETLVVRTQPSDKRRLVSAEFQRE